MVKIKPDGKYMIPYSGPCLLVTVVFWAEDDSVSIGTSEPIIGWVVEAQDEGDGEWFFYPTPLTPFGASIPSRKTAPFLGGPHYIDDECTYAEMVLLWDPCRNVFFDHESQELFLSDAGDRLRSAFAWRKERLEAAAKEVG